jgi:hypothetical protein
MADGTVDDPTPTVIRCIDCGVEWEMDYDPPECDDSSHEYALTIGGEEVGRSRGS